MTAPVEFTSRYQSKMYLMGDTKEKTNLGFRRIEFKGGHFSTDDPELIDWLCSHADFGSEIFRFDTPGAFVPADTSTRVVGAVASTKSVAEPRQRGGSRPPVAQNVVEPVEGVEAT